MTRLRVALRKVAVTCALLLVAATASAQNITPVVSEGVVDAPLAQVWRAWATAEGLRSWMAPVADIDLRVGGLMRANYAATGSLEDDGAIHNTVLSFEPERMLSIKVARFPTGFPFPNAIRNMWTVILLSPVEGGRTLVHAASLGFTPDEESQKMRAFFEQGNAVTLQALQKRFAR